MFLSRRQRLQIRLAAAVLREPDVQKLLRQKGLGPQFIEGLAQIEERSRALHRQNPESPYIKVNLKRAPSDKVVNPLEDELRKTRQDLDRLIEKHQSTKTPVGVGQNLPEIVSRLREQYPHATREEILFALRAMGLKVRLRNPKAPQT